MNRKNLSLALAVTLACGLPAAALTGQIVYADGEVSVSRGGAAEPAEIGDTVKAGDTIVTGRDGTAIITVQGQADIKLREATTLVLDRLDDQVAISLKTGGVFSRVARTLDRRYTIVTDAAVAGVRGTEFFVAYGRKIDDLRDVWLCVNEGTVEVQIPAASQTVLVEEGTGINIVGGTTLTSPRRYPWTRRLNWNVDAARGGVSDRTDLDQAYSDLLDQDYD